MDGEPIGSGPQRTMPRAQSTQCLSRTERVALFLHRESDRRLSPLGVWIMRYQRATERPIPILRLVAA